MQVLRVYNTMNYSGKQAKQSKILMMGLGYQNIKRSHDK